MIPSSAALLIVDVQQGIDLPKWGVRSTPEAEANIVRLLETWRRIGWPVLHVQHLSTSPDSPLRPGEPGCDIKPEAAPLPDERLFQKGANSAFIGTELEAHLRDHGITSLVIVGLTTGHCVSATARMAGDLGYETFVVADATATFGLTAYDGRQISADDVHAVSLATLHEEFATVIGTEAVLTSINDSAASTLPVQVAS